MSKKSSKARILSSARELFFEKGFEHVSTDMLARAASVSKASIYRHFDNMFDVLDQVAAEEAAKFTVDLPREITTHAALQKVMTDFGRELLGFLNLKETLDFSRLIHEESRTNPRLGQTFYRAAFGRVRDDLTALFNSAQDSGILQKDVATVDIAEDFCALLQGFGLVRVQLCVADIAFSDIDTRVARAVRTILATHGA